MTNYLKSFINKIQDILGIVKKSEEGKQLATKAQFLILMKNQKPESVNLNTFYSEIKSMDSGVPNLTPAMIKEIFAILGKRWRTKTFNEVLSEVYAIFERAGKN